MNLREGLIQQLLATSTITAIVGRGVFPAGRVPQGKALEAFMPSGWKRSDGERFVTVQRISDRGEHHHGGRVNQAFTTWQINAWAPRPSVQDQLDDAIRDAFDGKTMALGSVADCVIHKESEFDVLDDPGDGSEDVDVGTAFQFAISHPRAAT